MPEKKPLTAEEKAFYLKKYAIPTIDLFHSYDSYVFRLEEKRKEILLKKQEEEKKVFTLLHVLDHTTLTCLVG